MLEKFHANSSAWDVSDKNCLMKCTNQTLIEGEETTSLRMDTGAVCNASCLCLLSGRITPVTGNDTNLDICIHNE